MSGEDDKRAVAEFVERCQNQHDLDFADEIFHPEFVEHYRPGAALSRRRVGRRAASRRFTERCCGGSRMRPWR